MNKKEYIILCSLFNVFQCWWLHYQFKIWNTINIIKFKYLVLYCISYWLRNALRIIFNMNSSRCCLWKLIFIGWSWSRLKKGRLFYLTCIWKCTLRIKQKKIQRFKILWWLFFRLSIIKHYLRRLRGVTIVP